MHPFAPQSLIIPFVVLVFALVIVVGWGLGRLRPNLFFRLKVVLGLALFLKVPALLALGGVLSQFDSLPPPFMMMMVVLFAVTTFAAFSPLGRAVIDRYDYAALVGIQAFRLPLELVMHHAAAVSVMPSVMSFDLAAAGRNFDILTGISALLLWPLLRKPLLRKEANMQKTVVWLWNIAGFALLINVVMVAILATPLFLHFGLEQENTWVAYFPFVWLPAICVTTALGGHLLIFRKLLRAQ